MQEVDDLVFATIKNTVDGTAAFADAHDRSAAGYSMAIGPVDLLDDDDAVVLSMALSRRKAPAGVKTMTARH